VCLADGSQHRTTLAHAAQLVMDRDGNAVGGILVVESDGSSDSAVGAPVPVGRVASGQGRVAGLVLVEPGATARADVEGGLRAVPALVVRVESPAAELQAVAAVLLDRTRSAARRVDGGLPVG
jgi:hypothetical protein